MHVRAQGRVGAPAGSEAKLSFAGSGIVARIDVHVGEAVRAGDALAELDTSGLALDLAQARADASAQPRLIAAQSRLSALERGDGSAQSDREAADAAVRQSEERLVADQRALDRTQALFTGGVAAQKDLDAARQQLELDRADLSANRARAATARAGITGAITQARADVAQAAADVQAARIRLAMAQRNVAIATLRAPASGVVSQILKHPGEAVDPTQPAIVVGPPTTHIVTLTVAGDDAARVAVGAAVDVQVVGRGLRGHGIVRSVVASVDPATQASTVLVDGVPDGAAPGEAVEATIDAGERRGIVIPTAAIVEDPQSGTSVVFVREKTKDGEKFVSRTIGVAAGDEAKTLVTGGLKVGEQIAAQGAFDLLAPAGGG
jgi:HlyD family secretion protein